MINEPSVQNTQIKLYMTKSILRADYNNSVISKIALFNLLEKYLSSWKGNLQADVSTFLKSEDSITLQSNY